MLTKEQTLGIIRHILTGVGGALVTIGILETAMVTELIGCIVTTVGLIWSVIKNNKK